MIGWHCCCTAFTAMVIARAAGLLTLDLTYMDLIPGEYTGKGSDIRCCHNPIPYKAFLNKMKVL